MNHKFSLNFLSMKPIDFMLEFLYPLQNLQSLKLKLTKKLNHSVNISLKKSQNRTPSKKWASRSRLPSWKKLNFLSLKVGLSKINNLLWILKRLLSEMVGSRTFSCWTTIPLSSNLSAMAPKTKFSIIASLSYVYWRQLAEKSIQVFFLLSNWKGVSTDNQLI